MIPEFITSLGINNQNNGTWIGGTSLDDNIKITSYSPITGQRIAEFSETSDHSYNQVVEMAIDASNDWKKWPAPKRGELVRQYGMLLREHKTALGKTISFEMGKSLQEGWGEVQEMIDICDFAAGLSRQLYGNTMHSERPGHRMYEQWHPLGLVGIISAFNFPMAVWAWNTMIALVCGDVCIWKASEKTPTCALACQLLLAQVLKQNEAPEGVSSLITGGSALGQKMSADRRIPLISATGSCKMGRSVATTVAQRLGKSLLELGGNNAMIISQHADLDIVIRGVVFGAIGTAAQRCTSTRRLIIHKSIYEPLVTRLKSAYAQLKIGSPLDPSNHLGPLIDKDAVKGYVEALKEVRLAGGQFIVEGGLLTGPDFESGCYVKPCIARVENHFTIVQNETFAPILYLMTYSTLEEAVHLQNAVAQGLSSAIMTSQLDEAEYFLSSLGSDCGIANVNIGTSGAEIGGAFGGEKDTGGGRESGSDAWKAYMRRQTNTINYSGQLPLAQGIRFDL